jgi:hypothetical protein
MDNISATTLFGGGAIIATITMLWDKIRFLASRCMSFIIVSVSVDYKLYTALQRYVLKNMTAFKYQPLEYRHLDCFIRPLKRKGMIGYKSMPAEKLIYFWKGRPFFLSDMKEDAGKNTSKGDVFTFSFIRGTFDHEKILQNAIDLLNKSRWAEDNQLTSRYTIRYYLGQNNFDSKIGNAPVSPTTAIEDVNTNDKGDLNRVKQFQYKILKWNIDDLGEEKLNNKITYLSYPKEVDGFLNEIDQWKKSELWYKERQIPWKRGLLFYGKPGTGKSALVSAIAQYHDFPICVFDLSSMSNNEFKDYWNTAQSYAPCIVLIEDIDNVFHGRTNITKRESKDSLTFDCFLNTISGVQNSDGILLIVTSNDIDKLDEAIGKPRTDKHVNGTFISTRPGRIDKVLELKIMDKDCRLRLAQRILSDCPEFIPQIVENGEGDTGAQFQERCSQVALSEYWRRKDK